MTNPELIKLLQNISKQLKSERHHVADALDYLIFIAKQRLDPDL